MNYKNIQKYVEYAMFLASMLLLAFFIVRTYFLYRYDWDNIRGPLAPREYYELGLLDDPIPSKEYYPYTVISEPASAKSREFKISEPDKPEATQENTKDLTVSDENSNR